MVPDTFSRLPVSDPNAAYPLLVAFVTRSGYDRPMKTVRIAELKARLSGYLREVRRGRSVTILDRETPIARIVPYAQDAMTLVVRQPHPGAPPPGRVKLPPPLRITGDIGNLLLEERQGNR